MTKVISMTRYGSGDAARLSGIRDRRYTIRYPFAADAEMIDMESGKQLTGVTSDISLGGCFICTSKTFAVNTRARMQLTRKGQTFDAMVVVRIVKPRIGVGVEFFEVEAPNDRILSDWIESLRRKR
jgi:PilZ domain